MFHLLLAIIYLAFISLGLPDALLGAAWPTMYQEFGVPISYAGAISMIISAGTIVSSLQCDRLTKRLGTGKVTAISVAITAISLFGFSISHSYIALFLWGIPYGLGAGCIDASLNNYVALHYESRHMSWLHCMWGVGASIGPYIMSFALTNGLGWNKGYLYIALIQVVLTFIIFLSLPLWKSAPTVTDDGIEIPKEPLPLKEILGIRGAKEVLLTFFCYCAMESTAMLWAASYFVLKGGLSEETAAGLAGLFFIGITSGRAVSGFLTIKFDDKTMIRIGSTIITLGILLLVLPFGTIFSAIGLLLIGLGCAPVYPCIIHSTPAHFGADKSQAIIGVQMASAYIGTCLMPPVFGLIANHISAGLFPWYLLLFLVAMIYLHEKLLRVTKSHN